MKKRSNGGGDRRGGRERVTQTLNDPRVLYCHSSKSTLPFALAPSPQRSACLKLCGAQETKQPLSSGRKPWVTSCRSILVLLGSLGPHLPRLLLSGQQLETVEPIQGLDFPLIRGQSWGVRRLQQLAWTPVFSVQKQQKSHIEVLQGTTTPANLGHASSSPASGLTPQPHRAEIFPARAKRSSLTFPTRLYHPRKHSPPP